MSAAGNLDGPGQDSRARRDLIDEAAMQARLHQNAYDRFEDAAAAYVGVNRTAMRCMDVLERLGQLTAGEIAIETGLTSGAVTAMLDRLEGMGLIQRLADQFDRRRVLVQLTDNAREIAAEIYGPLVEAIEEFERYTDDELRLIGEFMRLATATLKRHADRVEAQTAERRPARARRVADDQQREAARAQRDTARAEREAARAERQRRPDRGTSSD